MIGIIVTGHGGFATGLASNARLLAGGEADITAIDFNDGYTPEELEEDLRCAIETYKDRSSVMILTDIMGGTPYLKAAALSVQYEKVRVLHGVSAALLLDLVIRNMSGNDGADPDSLAEELLQTAREGLGVFKLDLTAPDETEEEDGI